MAIQLRRGAYADFDPQKMKPAEVAVVQEDDPTSHDGKAVYVAISPGDVKRMAVLDELQDEVYNQIDTAISTATQAAVVTATQAAAESASDAAASASAAAESARTLTIDSTLTRPGQAADSKVVGDAIEEITVVGNLFDARSIISGGYYSASGAITANENSYYSTQYIGVEEGVSYTLATAQSASYYIATYNSNKEFVSREHPSGYTFTPASGVAFVKLSIYNQQFPANMKLAKTADYATTPDEHRLLNGLKIHNAPYQSIITHDDISMEIEKDRLLYRGNYYPGSDGTKTSLNTQTWYELTASNDFQVWADASFTYPSVMLAIYNNGTATKQNFVARYRKSASENTLPTEENKLSVTKGQLLVVSVQNDSGFVFLTDGFATGKKIFDDGVFLNAEMVSQTQDKISVAVETGKYTISFGKYKIVFAHIVNANTRADLWNFKGITKNGQTIVGEGTDIVGVVREDGQSDYMGGVHGDETNVDMYILADGVPITTDVTCNRIDILMYSHLTRVSTGDSIVDRTVHITIKNGVIETEATFTSLIDNLVLSRILAGGMFAWYESDKVYATSNIGELVGSGSSGVAVQESHELYTATAILNSATVICENIIGRDVDGTYGQAYYYGNEANPRMKLYLGALKNITMNTGDVKKGKARYTLL